MPFFMAQVLSKSIFMVKKVVCVIFVALSLTLSGYAKGDLKQLIAGKWQRAGGSAPQQPCEYQNWYEFSSDTTYVFYMACNNVTETGALSVNVGNNTISMLPSGLFLPFVCDVVSINEKKLVLRFGNNKKTYKYKRIK